MFHFGEKPKLHPVVFFSRKLIPAEQNYNIANRELLAIKVALEEWRHWLEGATHPFVILTDHNLEYLKSAKRLNPRQVHWALFFTHFQFSISYWPGSKNTRADALSRIHSTTSSNQESTPILPPECFINAFTWENDKELAQTQPHNIPETCPPRLMCVPWQLKGHLITWVHSSPATGHPNSYYTYQLLKIKYWWENMITEINEFVSFCAACAQAKVPQSLPAGKLMPLSTPQCPGSHIAIDFITDLPNSQGHTVIMLIIDRFSKTICLIPFSSLPTAFETAELIFTHVL